jgi:hypothetical protein
MTKIAIEPNISGTGRFTIAAPNSNTNRTITLPDNTGTLHLNQNAIQVPAGSAASPSLSPTDDPNTGIFFPTADTMAFVEGGVEQMRLDATGNLQFNSGYGSVATAFGCRAWVNFNGTGTVAIRGSGNVTSITDNGVGSYTVNFVTAMPDVNYAAIAMPGFANTGQYETITILSQVANAVQVGVAGADGPAKDVPIVAIAIFR